MKKIFNKNSLFSYRALLIGFLWALFILLNTYQFLRYLGVQKLTDVTNLNLFVPWMHVALNSKNFFKLTYNISIIFLPVASVSIALLISYYIRNPNNLLRATLSAGLLYFFLVHLPPSNSIVYFITLNSAVLVVFTLVHFVKIKKSLFVHKRSVACLKRFFSIQDSIGKSWNRSTVIQSVNWFLNAHWIETLIVMLVITLFNFGYFAEAGVWVNYYHHHFMMGTINDLLHDKHLLVDTFNQYGLLYPYFLYLLFKVVIPFSYLNLYFLFMVLTIVYFFIYFFFLKRLTGNNSISLIGLYVTIGLYMLFSYPTFPTSENYVWPGSIPLRHFFDIGVFYLLLKSKNRPSQLVQWLTSGLVALSFFYNLETGISLVIAYGYFHLVFAISSSKKLSDKIIFLFSRMSQLAICLLVFFSAISLLTFYQSGQFPNWKLFSFFALLYQAGFTSVTTPKAGVYLLYLFVYFVVFTTVLYRVIMRRAVSWKWLVMSGLSVYGLFTFNYYMGRSVESNLPLNSVSFATLLIFIFIETHKWLKETKHKSYFILLKSLRILLVLVLFYFAIKTSYYLVKRVNYRMDVFFTVQKLKRYPFNRGFVVLPYTETSGFTADDLLASVAEIKKLTKGSDKILLFSRFDVTILVMSEKAHLVPYPMIEQIYFVSDLKKIKRNLVSLRYKPKYMFTEKKNENPFEVSTAGKLTSYDTSRELIKALLPYYKFKKQVGILDIYILKNEENKTVKE